MEYIIPAASAIVVAIIEALPATALRTSRMA